MTIQFLMLKVVPNLLVGISIRPVLGKAENVQTRLRTDPCSGLLRRVWWRLIHHNDQVSTRMMAEHLMEELDDFSGSDAFLHESEQQLSRRLMADVAATPARLPVTLALGVCPHGAHVLPRNAVNEMFDSS